MYSLKASAYALTSSHLMYANVRQCRMYSLKAGAYALTSSHLMYANVRQCASVLYPLETVHWRASVGVLLDRVCVSTAVVIGCYANQSFILTVPTMKFLNTHIHSYRQYSKVAGPQ